MSVSTTQSPGTATPASLNPVVPANSASPDKTDSITIVVGIIGAVLALASVVVAILQYRIQRRKRQDVDVEGGAQVIEMDPLPVRQAEGTVAALPSPPKSMEPSFVRRGTL